VPVPREPFSFGGMGASKFGQVRMLLLLLLLPPLLLPLLLVPLVLLPLLLLLPLLPLPPPLLPLTLARTPSVGRHHRRRRHRILQPPHQGRHYMNLHKDPCCACLKKIPAVDPAVNLAR